MNGDIPSNWTRATVGELGEIIRGVTYKKGDARETPKKDYLPILRATNIQNNNLVLDRNLVYVPSQLISNTQKLQIGDIVIATSSGSKHLVGKTAQVKETWSGSFGAFCAAIRLSPEIEHRYLGYFFNSPEYKNFISSKAMGVNINNLRRGDLEEIQVPLAPFNEQKTIVSEIEKQFSRLDEAVAALKRIKSNLKRYKASVLKAAVEGKLTEKWRKEHLDIDPASELLAQIKLAREDRYQKQIKEWENTLQIWESDNKKGKKPIKPRKPLVLETLTDNVISEYHILPEGWCWEKLGNLAFLITDGTHLRPTYTESGIPFLSVKNVRPGKIYDDNIKYISKEQHQEYIRRCKPERYDILYTKVGATYGYAAINLLDYEFSIYVSLCLIKFPFNFILPKYIEICLNSKLIYAQAQRRIKGIGRPDLHLEEIREFCFPLCSIQEQEQVISIAEENIAQLEHLEKVIDNELVRAERLRQSILKKAFSGKLVSQRTGAVN